jgi:hypothetical protein
MQPQVVVHDYAVVHRGLPHEQALPPAACQPSVCARHTHTHHTAAPTFQLWEHSSDQKASAAAACCSWLALSSCRGRQEQLSAPHLTPAPAMSCAQVKHF